MNNLQCSNNQLTHLDVSMNPGLLDLYCGGNKLTVLNITNNTSLRKLDIHNMPTLDKVCVWALPFPPSDLVVEATDSPNVYFSTDCSK
jgi:hypothetical protein